MQKNECGGFSIDGLEVNIVIGVHFRSTKTMPGKCTYDVFKKFEQDHVNDLQGWAKTVKGLGDSFIKSNSANFYSEKKECERDNAQKFYEVLWPTLSNAAQQSHQMWDEPAGGLHACSP